MILVIPEDKQASETGKHSFSTLGIVNFSQSPNMFTLKTIPSTTSVLSTYTTFTALALLLRGHNQPTHSEATPDYVTVQARRPFFESIFPNDSPH